MNIKSTTDLSSPPIKRPKMVWAISLFYFLSAGHNLLSFILIYSGLIPLNEAQETYFKSQSILDHVFSALIFSANLAGAILLFLLKKYAYQALLYGFIITILMLIYQIIFKNWITVIGTSGFIGTAVGLGISISVILYSKKLVEKRILS
ncbi:hypothetical protein OAK75_06060 [Bacteriovoracales bacterium]|nr:hypothetical protein [Bacteriovoracales bacterium]